ncbi:MAG: Asp-tRNA(Asn)/Glu-tRNA(Gln) amidotransferase GatCAB subunit C [Candidatus Nealsonbacteria bacterium CG15_BIG_FIL_POST_REV_8_21_14_020_37_12]|uniref:Aspartyl/glutamyl-tRNA(Asn/Gln) amidotransferase subunit C n=2 Tax=Parcubacteria group TaxID=1794811 RepID=A0A2M7H0Q3_9BACT|nr:MAG: Asp-tRNA(Asn)/Glu-tRNA(Gln) amidotransferase GatCAB subunit C [Candidatus Nealsonbacteria bacterium CG15_BIG_FIL_POST_REV_8_21_14_020_37_12]PIZ44440.1 MAG: Asp-tRNA(Asn)/Glu-tRNA(Gln) amidotransferase GatCAB subunit C [Candidatus Wolfebacteria bacterium CG_4_10_14_0_2_um_filter_39_18]
MPDLINKKTLEYLAGLGRIELDKKHEEKMLGDLQNILGHFDELKEVDTEDVEPLAGGTIETNVFRNDEGFKLPADAKALAGRQVSSSNLTKAFPEKEGDFLKVPPVFE